MLNSSIYDVFERMWQHIVVALNNKSDKSDVENIHNLVGDTSVSDQITAALNELDNTDIYIQNDEPTDVPDGSLWVDMDADGYLVDLDTADDSVFYATLSAAVADINNGVTTNAVADASTAKVKVFTRDGRTNVMLLDNVSESTQIDINKDIDLVLNGKTLSLTTVGAYLNFGSGTDCTINGEVDGSTITKVIPGGTTPFYLVSSNGVLKMDGGSYYIETAAAIAIVAIRIGATCSECIIDSCFITAKNTDSSGTKYATRAIQNQGSNTVVNNSEVVSRASSGVATAATIGAGTVYINDSKMIADAPDCHATSSADSMGLEGYPNTHIFCNNATVFGTHSGCSGKGSYYVNGGTYTGFCHGGFYFSKSSAEYFINDAIICAGNYEGEFDYSGKSAEIYGAFYIGTGSNTTAYLDNCTIDGTGCTQGAFVMRGTDGESNNTVNISNSTVTSGTIRIDPDLGHKLNIGMGGNITADMVNNPAYVEMTNDLYRRNHAEKVLNGNDFSALLNAARHWANMT